RRIARSWSSPMRGDRLAIGGLVAAAAIFGVAAFVGGAAWRAWLAAAVLFSAAPTGALTVAMMLRLIPGAWREGLIEPLALAQALLPPSLLAMLPILVAPGHVYGWAQYPGPGAFRAVWMT